MKIFFIIEGCIIYIPYFFTLTGSEYEKKNFYIID